MEKQNKRTQSTWFKVGSKWLAYLYINKLIIINNKPKADR